MQVPSLTRAERAEYGKLERRRCGRSSLGQVVLSPSSDRVAAVFAQEHDRVQSLLPLRHERMSASPFAFFRGSAVLMAGDLGAAPSTRLFAQVCGDAHAANFGVFGSPERRLVFDLNDFDETYRGPFEWDLKRLAVSLLLAADDAGLRSKAAASVVASALESYTEHMAAYAEMPTLQVWYARLDGATIERHLDERRLAQAREQADSARGRSVERALQKFVQDDEQGRPRFRERPPRLQRVPEGQHAQTMLLSYLASLPPEWAELMRRYRLRDLAFKAVGVGSVGTRCYVAVLDSGDPGDRLLIQLKEAGRSVLAPHVRGTGPRHQGRRVVVGQKLMQAVGDVLLGWTRHPETGRDYYVRQLWDLKGDIDLAGLDRHALETHAMLCGWALARAHGRTGDPVAIAAYLGSKGRVPAAVLDFAEQYQQVVQDDYQAYLNALDAIEPLGDERVELPGWAG
jgi:uncharacterized protein (DUF2252 family)